MITATIKRPVKSGKSKTGPQVLTVPIEQYSRNKGVLDKYTRGTLTYYKVRQMRKDPTIAMVRQLIVAPALMAPWHYQETSDAPKGAKDFIKDQLDEMRGYLVRTTLFGCIDFGWQSYEKVFGKSPDGKVVLTKMKALLPDYAEILINVDTGAFLGLRELNRWTGGWNYITLKKSFCHAFDVEGTYWYGASYMANAEEAFDQWAVATDANARYDAKIAGSHWVIHYPMGTSSVNGEEKDNEAIAQDILSALKSSGGIAVPKKVEEFITDLDKETPNSWEIDLISDTGATQANFLERMAYLDKLKVRAFGFPERSILEGKYGTKAEAETHADFAVTNILLRASDLIRDLNWHLVDQLLTLNYGPEAAKSVRITSGSIGSENKRFLRDIYMELIKDADGFVQEMSTVDLAAMRELLMIPVDSDAEGSDLFEKKLEDLEEKADKPDDILNPIGPGIGLRQEQLGEVGRPGQFRGSDANPHPKPMGDNLSGRTDRQPPERQPIRDSIGDSIANRN